MTAKRSIKSIFLLALMAAWLSPLSGTTIGQDLNAIRSGETRLGSITTLGEVDTYDFYGEAGEGVLIFMTRTGDDISFSPSLELYDPDGVKEEDGFSTIENHRLRQTGLYTIVCREFLDTTTGGYALTLLKFPGPLVAPSDRDGGDIASGRVLSGTIMPKGDLDAFHFYGHAGDSVIINMTRTSSDISFGRSIQLYDPTGMKERTGLSSIQNYRLLRSGLYTIVCREFQDDFTGSYNLSLTKVPSRVPPGVYNPKPTDGEIVPAATDRLDWADTEGATMYDVFFGSDVTAPMEKIQSNLIASSGPLPPLNPGTTYYWKVVAKSGAGVVATGPVWMFSVAAPADP
jgi:hypothetical protein